MMETFKFGEGSVPVRVAAKVYGKDSSWIREGIKAGWLPIGTATRHGEPAGAGRGPKRTRTNYYISPKLLYEHTGYLWKGETNARRKETYTETKSLLDTEV